MGYIAKLMFSCYSEIKVALSVLRCKNWFKYVFILPGILMTTRKTLANAIRFLSMDAVQKAKSGHPGAPMGMADIAEVLWRDHMNHNPADPHWADRDRFVLSNGHGSMLIYSLLHLTGYDLSIEELKISANYTLKHRATQNMAILQVLKQQPVL